MKSYLKVFFNMQDKNFLQTHTRALMECELPQTNSANHKAADYIYNLLESNGFTPERHNFISDGKKNCQDKIMPLCWEVSYARLTVKSEWDGERVIADYEKEPFSIIRFSTPTQKGGIDVRLVLWEDMLSGADVTGAFVLLPPDLMPTDKALRPILEHGAIGLVSGTAKTGSLSPDTTHWSNNCTETNSWYVNADERDFIGFCVTPNIREKLYNACKKGEVILNADTDSHRFVGTMPAVSALVNGESEREFWIMAHSGEPLEDDNSAGVISAIYSMIAINKAVKSGDIPPLKYSVRLLFAPELYGYAAFSELYGGTLHDRTVGAISIDGVPCSEDKNNIQLIFAPPAVPFYSNVLLEAVWREYEAFSDKAPKVDGWKDSWANDCFLSDSSVGLPTIMPEPSTSLFWHNSKQRYGYIDYDKLSNSLVGFTSHIAATVCPNAERFNLLMPVAADYALSRLHEYSALPIRSGDSKRARLEHIAKLEIADLRDFSKIGVNADNIEKAVQKITDFIASYTAEEDTLPDALKEYESVIPSRLTVGVPHDFALIPLEERYRPFILPLMSVVFSGMDGKKSLAELIRIAEWEQKTFYTPEQLSDFYETLLLMQKFGYISIKA